MGIGPGQVQFRGSRTIAACRTSKVRQELKESVFQEISSIYAAIVVDDLDLYIELLLVSPVPECRFERGLDSSSQPGLFQNSCRKIRYFQLIQLRFTPNLGGEAWEGESISPEPGLGDSLGKLPSDILFDSSRSLDRFIGLDVSILSFSSLSISISSPLLILSIMLSMCGGRMEKGIGPRSFGLGRWSDPMSRSSRSRASRVSLESSSSRTSLILSIRFLYGLSIGRSLMPSGRWWRGPIMFIEGKAAE